MKIVEKWYSRQETTFIIEIIVLIVFGVYMQTLMLGIGDQGVEQQWNPLDWLTQTNSYQYCIDALDVEVFDSIEYRVMTVTMK